MVGAYVLSYRLEDRPDELWTDRFTRFKFASDESLATGTTIHMAHAARTLVCGLDLSAEQTALVPALRSAERTADPEGVLAMIAGRCAEAAGCCYRPEMLRKNEALHKNINLPTGRGALDPAFRVMLVEDTDYRSAPTDADTVFIVDVFVCTGKALSLAAKAIRQINEGTPVIDPALAKLELY